MIRKQNEPIDHSSLRARGSIGENAVCAFLVRHGYEITDRNFTVKGGEIDIIARKGEMLCFVEVKSRREDPLTEGEVAVDTAKRRHIIYAAQRYLERIGREYDCRFDVAVVTLKENTVSHLKYYVSAFDASK
ncbi:MAG: YraN family protein [Ruminococcus sp.]|nr:YraN family protein [Ruminococcus sp.]